MRPTSLAWTAFLTTTAARTLQETVAQHSSLHMLHGILDTLGLFSTFSKAENATFLAMTDTAIQFLTDWGIDLTAVDPDVARSILQYHVLEGRHSSAKIGEAAGAQLVHSILRPPHFTNVSAGPMVKLRRGEHGNSVLVESGLQTTFPIVEADIRYDGGIIHTIDRNLVLPHNLLETTNVGSLQAFWRLVERSKLQARLESLKDTTILIPSDNAIREALSSLEKLDPAELADVLANHALPNHILYHNAVGETVETYQTLNGQHITVRRSVAGHMLVNDAAVLRHDILIYGGIAHVIDGLLVPPSFAGRTANTMEETSSAMGNTVDKGKLSAGHAWPWMRLARPSHTDLIHCAGIAAIFCGLAILRLLRRQHILDMSGRETLQKVGEHTGTRDRNLVRSEYPSSAL